MGGAGRFKATWCPRCNKEQPYQRCRKWDPLGKETGKVTRCVVCREPVQLSSKYNNVPTRSKHTARTFQSKLEASREPTLIAWQNVGAIKNLRYQVPYDLEVFSTPDVIALMQHIINNVGTLPEVGEFGRLVRNVQRSRTHVARYIADFVYETETGQTVVEDMKGAVTDVYRMKKRLMVAAHNIEIIEPRRGGVQQRARGAGVSGVGTGSRLKGGR